MSSKEIIYRGSKGSFHRKNQNSRAVRTTNWLQFCTVNYCGGSIEECEKIVNRYHELYNGKDTKTQANGMLSVFIEQGAKRETLLREVFGIGTKIFIGTKILYGQLSEIFNLSAFISSRGLSTPRGVRNVFI